MRATVASRRPDGRSLGGGSSIHQPARPKAHSPSRRGSSIDGDVSAPRDPPRRRSSPSTPATPRVPAAERTDSPPMAGHGRRPGSRVRHYVPYRLGRAMGQICLGLPVLGARGVRPPSRADPQSTIGRPSGRTPAAPAGATVDLRLAEEVDQVSRDIAVHADRERDQVAVVGRDEQLIVRAEQPHQLVG